MRILLFIIYKYKRAVAEDREIGHQIAGRNCLCDVVIFRSLPSLVISRNYSICLPNMCDFCYHVFAGVVAFCRETRGPKCHDLLAHLSRVMKVGGAQIWNQTLISQTQIKYSI
jgi:hypothetical protein